MKAENILTEIKNILDKKIARLESKVADDDENSFINGMLLEAQSIRQTIENYEEFPDWYGEKKERTMSEYKRLTIKGGDWYGDVRCDDEGIYTRLGELEDKMEEGTLIEMPRIVHPNRAEWLVYYQYPSGVIQYDICSSQAEAEARLKEMKDER
jgi:hypothetical protein